MAAYYYTMNSNNAVTPIEFLT